MAIRIILAFAALAIALLLPGAVLAQDNAFSYQGYLTDSGSPVNGQRDFRFTLWDAPTGGSQFGGLDQQRLTVTEGLFTAILNDDNEFGEEWLTDATELYLDILIAPPGGSYVSLGRQRITRSPYASTTGSVITPINLTVDIPEDVVCIENQGLGGVLKLMVNNVFSPASALRTVTNGPGLALDAETSGGGIALRARALTTGRAGLFEITDPANTLDALEVTTAGTGRALRAFSTGGIGLLAASGAGVGLRATSTSGMALEVVGASAFSGTAAFNAPSPTAPFTVASNALVPNLNVGLFDGQAPSFYRNASNLNAGTVPNARLAATIARLNTIQTFTAQQTFSFPTFFDARVEIDAPGVAPALLVTNSGTGSAAEFAGAVHVRGEIIKAYTTGTSNPAAPLAYGYVASDGTLVSGTPNVMSRLEECQGLPCYAIAVAGETYTLGSFVTIVTPEFGAGVGPLAAAVTANSGELIVRLHRLNGTPTQQAFQFIIYKP